MYVYLVKDTQTKEQKLVKCSSPAVALAHVAGQKYTTQRVDGAVLDTLEGVLGEPEVVKKSTEAKPETAEGDKADTTDADTQAKK